MEKNPLFSVTKKDLVRQTFRSGGKGGQNQNKVESGVRFIHPPSGARGEARDSRDQGRNERSAFERLISSATFQIWMKAEVARRTGRHEVVVTAGADKGPKIRTYHYPRQDVLDHRTEKHYPLNQILDGKLDMMINDLLRRKKC